MKWEGEGGKGSKIEQKGEKEKKKQIHIVNLNFSSPPPFVQFCFFLSLHPPIHVLLDFGPTLSRTSVFLSLFLPMRFFSRLFPSCVPRPGALGNLFRPMPLQVKMLVEGGASKGG